MIENRKTGIGREGNTKMNMEKRGVTKKDEKDTETESIQNGKRKEVKIQQSFCLARHIYRIMV